MTKIPTYVANAASGTCFVCSHCGAFTTKAPCPACHSCLLQEDRMGQVIHTPIHQLQQKSGANSTPLDCPEETIKTLRGDYL